MSAKIVSIIVPIYNSERYLSSCIESIMKQSYSQLEIILVDDGSTDNSLRICNEYAEIDPRIMVVHQKNSGVSAARNTGLNHMTGEFFSFVDSDDELTANAIETLMNDILMYEADISSAVKSSVKANGDICNKDEDDSVTLYNGLEAMELSLEGGRQTNSVCAKLFKRSIFKDLRFVEGRHVNEDGFFLFQCFTLKPRMIQHNVSIYLYYVRTNSNSRGAFSDKYFDLLYFVDRKKQVVHEAFPELANKLISMEVRVNLFMLEILCRTKDKKYNEIQKQSICLVRKYYRMFDSKDRHKRRMAWIVLHGLYPLYKRLIYFKYYR